MFLLSNFDQRYCRKVVVRIVCKELCWHTFKSDLRVTTVDQVSVNDALSIKSYRSRSPSGQKSIQELAAITIRYSRERASDHGCCGKKKRRELTAGDLEFIYRSGMEHDASVSDL